MRSRKSKREIDRVPVVGEDGRETDVIIYQEFHATHTFGSTGTTSGLKDARTIEGYACNVIDEDTFEVVADPLRPAERLRRVGAGE